MATSRSLWQCYLQATFEVRLPDGARTVVPGDRHLFVDRLLAKAGAGTWSIITAFNPRSRELAAEVNAERQRMLVAHCQGQGWRWLPARGGDRSGRWGWEDSCLVLGILRSESLILGRRFGQNAILFGQYRGRARLLDCNGA